MHHATKPRTRMRQRVDDVIRSRHRRHPEARSRHTCRRANDGSAVRIWSWPPRGLSVVATRQPSSLDRPPALELRGDGFRVEYASELAATTARSPPSRTSTTSVERGHPIVDFGRDGDGRFRPPVRHV